MVHSISIQKYKFTNPSQFGKLLNCKLKLLLQKNVKEKKGLLISGLFFLFSMSLFSQNQSLSDSLIQVYEKGNIADDDELRILREIAANETNSDRKLQYSLRLVEIAEFLDSTDYLIRGYIEKGNALRLKSDLSHALESYLEGAKIAINNDLKNQVGSIYVTIADVFSIMENHENAVLYYGNAITILREENDSINLASALLNAGDEYFNQGELDTALLYFKESGEIFEAKNYEIGVAYNLGNVGLVYAELRRDNLAKENINKAIEFLEKLEDFYPISVYLTYMSDIYLRQKDMHSAVSYALQSLEIAEKYGLKEQISDANLKLSKIYEGAGDYNKAHEYFKSHITYRDSVNNLQSIQQIANLRTDFEVSQKQIEIDLLEKESEIQQLRGKRQRNLMYASGVALVSILLLALGIYKRFLYIKKTNLIIEDEKNRSDSLLLNILPEETALELKEKGKVKAKRFESVTVLFTDFKEFSQFAETLSPEKLVESVDYYFSKFDEIMDKYGLEKIKTVGDSYMCAGGIPYHTNDHAHKAVRAAFDIAKFVDECKISQSKNQICFDVRIGINTGPVVAGVVGTKKFVYDIWGDTVNIASRMESNSHPGKINISNNTYQLIKDDFDCEFRGKFEVKNKGVMKMYFVNGKKEKGLISPSLN